MIIDATDGYADADPRDTLTRKLSQASGLAALMRTAGDEALLTADVFWLLSDTLQDVQLAAKAVLYPAEVQS